MAAWSGVVLGVAAWCSNVHGRGMVQPLFGNQAGCSRLPRVRSACYPCRVLLAGWVYGGETPEQRANNESLTMSSRDVHDD